ncbi:MAG: D-lyxose/D-mannose family sugar isomerase [Lentisphaerae bacterium]|nr:D-lyxose/D-mannose family sugar isomerase [Lentisphaerota bacterium]
MKRSTINELIENAKALLHDHQITLPPFAYWTPQEWATKGHECDEIRECMLGWDVTDFATGEFDKTGLVVFTARNGHKTIDSYKGKTYCEKILISREGQVTPCHYHVDKQEDIINRVGGNLVIRLFNRADDGSAADTPVAVALDGVVRQFAAGEEVVLSPGESITIPPCIYHDFWGQPGKGPVISGEVSKVNDDNCDNFFLESLGRFPEIEEDSAPLHLLCTEYEAAV